MTVLVLLTLVVGQIDKSCVPAPPLGLVLSDGARREQRLLSAIHEDVVLFVADGQCVPARLRPADRYLAVLGREDMALGLPLIVVVADLLGRHLPGRL